MSSLRFRTGSAAGGPTRRVALAALVAGLLAMGFWAWSRGLDGPYLFDDHTTPLGDPASQSLSAWREHASETLRPVTKLTYAVEAETAVTSTPAFRRLTSLALLAASAGLLLVLIRQLAPGISPLWAALIAAVWFLHPVHADGVLFAAGRTTVLSGLFAIAALIALDRSQRWLAALLFALACLSRETAIATLLPLVALAMSRLPGQWRAVMRQLGPSLAVGALVFVWLLTTPRYMQLADYSMFGRPFWSSFVSQVSAVPVGLGLLFQPASLSIDYGIPLAKTFADPLFLLGALMYLSAATGVFVLYRRSAAAAVGLALWLAALLPTQSVVPKLDALTNRPLSLALAGLLLAVAPLLEKAARSLRARPQRRLATATVAGLAIALVAALTIATARRADLFRSELGIWQDAAAKSLVNARPHLQVAILLKQTGRNDAARQAVAAAARIDPFSSEIETISYVLRSREDSR